MDLPWGSKNSIKFVTNVGLITSDGPWGVDIMSAEWTHHVSYQPGFVVVCINPKDATHENIVATKEFGVSVAAEEQNVIASIVGNSSGHNVDKIKVLQELGIKFKASEKIKPPLVEGAVLTLECKCIRQIPLGDHTMFVGEVLDAVADDSKKPLVYHGLKFWRLGEQMHKPPQQELDRIEELLKKHKKRL